MRRVVVKVKEDHLQRLSKVKKPILAVAELMWNALDADASQVRVVFDRNSLGGVQSIRVIDNGLGIKHDEAIKAFESLGGSWKQRVQTTRHNKRLLHGKAGKGRFRAFSLGNLVEWRSTFDDNGGKASFSIRGCGDHLGTFEIDEPKAAARTAVGTEVTIDNIARNMPSLSGEEAILEITEYFALYLKAYKYIEVYYDGARIDPDTITDRSKDIDLGIIQLSEGQTVAAVLTVIEWKRPMERALYLCDKDGFCLQKTTPRIQAPGFTFTAYLKCERIRQLDEDGLLELEDMVPDLQLIIDKGREELRNYFRQRAAHDAALLVADWKAQEVYPYKGEPSSVIERAEREVFDVCALSVNEYLPEFDTSPAKSKRFAFSLLKEALSESPQVLQQIMTDLLDLSKEKQEDLAKLLKRTTLSSIISASKTVADRLNFIGGLEMLVFDPESKEKLLERSQLHRILAEQTWIFGEQFHLTVDDRSLTEVLRQHVKLLGRDDLVTDPVLLEDGSPGIVDLMLSRTIPTADPAKREHLVIELKRPKVAIDSRAEMQIRDYATAVALDPRFRDTDTKWVFWVVSDDVTESVRRAATQPNRPSGILQQGENPCYEIWVKTWGQIVLSGKARLQFFQDKLQYQADQDSALEYLREMHRKYLPDVLLKRD